MEITREEFDTLLQRLEDLEGQMQQVRARDIAPIAVKVGSFTCPAATGYKAVTGVGFKPRYVEFFIGIQSEADAFLGKGWMDYNGNQGCASTSFKGTTDLANSGMLTTSCLVMRNPDGVAYIVAVYVSMDSGGFTINFTSVSTAFTIFWKAVR